ncbi:hypothetical protein BH20ACT18_BH20ACT18_03350 [soil metagenome]
MPTKHERIGVVKDQALAEALESVASLIGPKAPTATVVHDLAIRGAQAMCDEETGRRELLRELAHWSTSDDPPWDPDVLSRVDELTAG